MRMPVPVLAALAALGGCSQGSDPTCAAPIEASIRLPAVPAGPGAGYFRIPSDAALVSVSSPRVQRIEMHETMSGGRMTSMRPIARATGDACGITFSPGGRHLMLFGIDPGVHAGDEIPLVFHFEQGPPRTELARVESAGGETR